MEPDPKYRLRRLNRIVTSEVGALDTSFLGRGRSLGAARVLSAIGRGCSDVAELRKNLGLDSGLMSRLLRGLENEGLVETAPQPDDARRRICSLTELGKREFAAYEGLSNAQAEKILKRHSQPQKLLAAIDMIACTFGAEQVEIAECDPRCDEARYCLSQYYEELNRRFEMGFDVSLSRDPDARDMVRPRGAFIIARLDGVAIGAVGLKGSSERTAEIKRLWLAPSARGLGLGRRLMAAAEDTARQLSIECLRLDTNSVLQEAVNLYRTNGWEEIERFNDDPYPDIFFEKRL
jgi:DNA-binding MarR family transcriptional regulator/GNAT superfamily N-acetyltransferase